MPRAAACEPMCRPSASSATEPKASPGRDFHDHGDRGEQEHEQGPALARAGPLLPEGVRVLPSGYGVIVHAVG